MIGVIDNGYQDISNVNPFVEVKYRDSYLINNILDKDKIKWNFTLSNDAEGLGPF